MREQALHDKATLGEPLTVDEQTQLDLWYAKLDAQELAHVTAPDIDFASHQAIQNQIEVTIVRVQAVTTEIQNTMQENERLRAQIKALATRLAEFSARAA